MAEGKENGVEVMYAEETIWCTQDAIASLFDKGRSTIAEHLSNIFKEGNWIKIQFVGISDELPLMVNHTTLNITIWMQ